MGKLTDRCQIGQAAIRVGRGLKHDDGCRRAQGACKGIGVGLFDELGDDTKPRQQFRQQQRRTHVVVALRNDAVAGAHKTQQCSRDCTHATGGDQACLCTLEPRHDTSDPFVQRVAVARVVARMPGLRRHP